MDVRCKDASILSERGFPFLLPEDATFSDRYVDERSLHNRTILFTAKLRTIFHIEEKFEKFQSHLIYLISTAGAISTPQLSHATDYEQREKAK